MKTYLFKKLKKKKKRDENIKLRKKKGQKDTKYPFIELTH